MRSVWVTDCKSIPEGECLLQHILAREDRYISVTNQKTWSGMIQINVWELKAREKRELLEENVKEKITCTDIGEWKNPEERILC